MLELQWSSSLNVPLPVVESYPHMFSFVELVRDDGVCSRKRSPGVQAWVKHSNIAGRHAEYSPGTPVIG